MALMRASRPDVGSLIEFFEGKTKAAGVGMGKGFGDGVAAVQQSIETYAHGAIGTRRKLRYDTDREGSEVPRKRRKMVESTADPSSSSSSNTHLKRSDSVHEPDVDPYSDDAAPQFTSALAPSLSFAARQPEAAHTSPYVLRTLVHRASTLGNSAALAQLQRTLFHWRARAAAGPPCSFRPDTSSHLSSSAEKFRYHYRRMDAASTSLSAAITRRYSAARMREAFEEHLALHMDTSADWGEGAVLGELFALVCPRALGAPCEGLKWNLFRRALRAGKRWLELEEGFTCGVFAMLPPEEESGGCGWVERGLSEGEFTVWCRVLGRCAVLGRMARAVETVVRRLAEDLPPGRERLWLEIEGVPEGRGRDDELAGLLEIVEADEVEEVREDEGDDSVWFI